MANRGDREEVLALLAVRAYSTEEGGLGFEALDRDTSR
jgi:hypothetical protein